MCIMYAYLYIIVSIIIDIFVSCIIIKASKGVIMSGVLKYLREKASLSQEELAKELGLSRQTIVKYENSEINFSADMIKKLSKFFAVDYSCFIDNKIPASWEYTIVPSNDTIEKQELRINIPQNNILKFKQVLLYILNKVGAKPNVGQTVIYKLLYFIDFDYYELFEEQLMGLTYIKNTYGPTPVDFAKIIAEMEEEGTLEEVKTEYFKKEQTKYLPRVKPDLSLLSAQELNYIDRELERLSDKSAKELSEFSHKDIPWIIARDKNVIEYESVFYRTPETSVREYAEEDD